MIARLWGNLTQRFEWRLLAIAVILGLPGAIFGSALIWALPMDWWVRGALFAVLGALLVGLVRVVRRMVAAPLKGLTNVVEAYRGGDYTVRGARQRTGDALGDLAYEINCLGGTLHEQRLRAMEATALLDKLIGSIDLAVLAFDSAQQLRVLNPAAGRLLGIALDGTQTAASLGLADLISADPPVRFVAHIAGRSGRWQVVRGTFRESGLAQHLLIISDVRQALREEERLAWQRLIRVIGHEVNNSLTPIKSMAQSLEGALAKELTSGKTRDDALAALRVIAERADSLGRFLKRYSSLARLPPARRRWQALAPLVGRVAALEPLRGMKLEVPLGLEANIDEDQLEQALINLAKNAVEAQPGRAGQVTLTVQMRSTDLRIVITDEGSGVTNLDNLFVPFFTTKPEGGGVGLVLARQIAEAHGGTLSLENRTDRAGAAATLDLPGAARRNSSG